MSSKTSRLEKMFYIFLSSMFLLSFFAQQVYTAIERSIIVYLQFCRFVTRQSCCGQVEIFQFFWILSTIITKYIWFNTVINIQRAKLMCVAVMYEYNFLIVTRPVLDTLTTFSAFSHSFSPFSKIVFLIIYNVYMNVNYIQRTNVIEFACVESTWDRHTRLGDINFRTKIFNRNCTVVKTTLHGFRICSMQGR